MERQQDRSSRRRAGALVLVLAALLVARAALASAAAPGSDDTGGVGANHKAPAAAPAATDTSPAEIGSHAEEVAAVLRQMSESLEGDAAFDDLAASVAAATSRIAERWTATERALTASPRQNVLDSLDGTWQAMKESLHDVDGEIEARARRRVADVATLDRLQKSWSHSLELAQAAHAPDEVIDRAQGTLAAIEATRGPIDQRRQKVLVLQDAVSRALQSCDDALDRIAAVRQLRFERMFTEREAPLWHLSSTDSATKSSLRIAADLEGTTDTEFDYLRNHGARFALAGGIFLVLGGLLRRTGAAEQASADVAPGRASARSALRMPWASAFLIAIALVRPLGSTPPAIPAQILLGALAFAGTRLLRPHVSRRTARLIYAFLLLFFFATVLDLVELSLVLRRIDAIGAVWTAAALMFGTDVALRGHAATDSARPRVVGLVSWLLRLLGACLVASGFSFIAGYRVLAVWLGGALQLGVGTLAVIAFRVAADGVLALALARPPLAKLRAVARRRLEVDRVLGALLDLAAAALWLRMALYRFEVLNRARELVLATLDADIRVGQLDLAVGRVLGFFVVVAGAYFVTRIVVFLLEEDVYSRMELPRGVPYALSTLTRYALLLFGFLLALATLGLDLTHMTVLVSAFGLGIGFGLQQIVNNFVSGLILLFERPVQVGDSVQLGDLSGRVDRIGIRSSTIRTGDGAEVIFPNAKIIDDRVTNWTLSDRRRRVTLDLTVSGTDDAGRIIDLLVETARRDPRVSAEPPPEALLVRFGEAQADFQLHAWTDASDWARLRSDLGIQVQRALRRRPPPPAQAGG